MPNPKVPPITQNGTMASGDVDSISDRDIIIAVMGATGVGKSSFINLAIANDRTAVGHHLHSCTQGVRAVRCSDPDNPHRKFVFLDTPGFDDTHKSDTQILMDIAEWLRKTYQRGIMLSGLLFLHRISDNRMTGTSLRNTHMFEMLCGAGALQNVILVTTMWGEVDKQAGSAREKELRAEFWKSMIASGSRMARFNYTHESAWAILDQFDGVPRPLRLQVELVDEGKSLGRTAAGLVLMRWLDQLIAQFRTTIITLRRRLGGAPKGSKISRELLRDEWAAQQGLSRITEEIHFLDSEGLVEKTVDAQGLADADARKATAISQPGVVTEARAQEKPEQKRQPVEFPRKAQARLQENEMPRAAELHAEKLALRGEIWENQRRSAEEAERKALEERRVADIRRTRTQEKLEQKRHTEESERKEHERLKEAERRRAEKLLAEKLASQENLRESQRRNAEEAERALEERRVEDNRRAEERRLELKSRSGRKALERRPTTKSAQKVSRNEKNSHNDTNPVELANFARKSFEIIALWKKQKCFDDPLVETMVARIVKQGPGYNCAMQKSAKTAQEGCFFGSDAINFSQRLMNAKDPLEFFKSTLDGIRDVAKNAHHDSHDTHRQFEWIRIELVKISKELPSSRVGRRADWDVLSQFESAINDLNTLIKHINSFVDWWGNMTIRLANLEETLPQVKVDENTTFRTDTFKERWMEVRGEYISYRRQISEVEEYCSDVIGDLVPSSAVIERLSPDKTAPARLVEERPKSSDDKRRSGDKRIAEEKAEIETARLSEEKREELKGKKWEAAKNQRVDEWRREEEKRNSEAETMRVGEEKRRREEQKQKTERPEAKEIEQKRTEQGEVEESRRVEIEAKRLLDDAKQKKVEAALQISEVEEYCSDVTGDLVPSSAVIEMLSTEKTTAARLVEERQQYLDEKRRSEEKRIAKEKMLKAEIETARLSEEEKREELNEEKQEAATNQRAEEWRRDEEKREREAEAMRITEKRNAEIENVPLREEAKQMVERLESEEAEQERSEQGEVEERRRAEIEAKRLLDEVKQKKMEAVLRAFEEARQKYERKEASGVDTSDTRQDHGGSAGHKSHHRHHRRRRYPRAALVSD